MFFGKLIGGLIGFFTFGIFGAIIGVMAGSFFDKGIAQAMGFDYGADRVRLQRLFFEAAFKIMGHLAKADGRISEEEIAQAEVLIERLGLTAENRKEAISFFKLGAQADFQLEPTIASFINEGGRQHNLPILLLEFLFSMALADGELHPAEKAILQRCAEYLGIGARQFEQLLAMLAAQQNFQGGQYQYRGGQQASSADELKLAYQALGVKATDSDSTIKKTYRKLMSQHHPDKLIAQGVPEDMLKVATEKAQEIQGAYDLIKQARK
ncbi:co-chaperone DjlA [Oceanicoccus sp. KOV_DT_Chl]|uniref:co-chaperone DjlA n=1 Tax=Oceanicoccus sp. KOV_DT_Chl TaxID=1904639 RepID=UPI000C7AB2FF|nr:co-chaperone DjlA [Oceanicoccus sp. KOV_DT_Chl]